MQISKSLLKRDVEKIEIKEIIEKRKFDNINGDWIRLTDYFSYDNTIVSELALRYKKMFGSLAPSISLGFLMYGLGLERREQYMNQEKNWDLVKKVIGKFPFDEYYDYENRTYDIHIKTLKTLHKTEYLNLSRNDFVHLETWIIAVYLAKIEELKYSYSPIRENRVLVSLSIRGNKRDVENVEEELRKDYGILFDLNAGWFIYS